MDELKDHVYIAELIMPTCFYVNRETRHVIDNPEALEIQKGYYRIGYPNDQPPIGGYVELILVIEFVEQGLMEAEDHALKVGRAFSSLLSAYGGYPNEPPYLKRVACTDFNANLTSEHHYCYRSTPQMLAQFDSLVGYQFERFLQSISEVDSKTKHQLQSAIHWYQISISSDEPTVSYVAAWTGLESIGTAVDRVAHPNGPKVRCGTCGNQAGKQRNRKQAGIDHMINGLIHGPLSESISEEARNRLANDFQGRLSPKEAHQLRSSIVHGLDEINSLVQNSLRARRFLQHVLNASIQVLLGQHVKSWMPGEYELHPEIRYSLKFKEGLVRRPYLGEWVGDLSCRMTEPSVQIGERAYIGGVDVQLSIYRIAHEFIESKSEEQFRRDVDIYNLVDETKMGGLSSWDNRPSEPEWVEFTYPAPGPDETQ